MSIHCGKFMKKWTDNHYYCPICGMHEYKGKVYSKEEWFNFLNEEYHIRAKALEAEQQDLMESPHAHEIINHSDPE